MNYYHICIDLENTTDISYKKSDVPSPKKSPIASTYVCCVYHRKESCTQELKTCHIKSFEIKMAANTSCY